MMSRAWSQQRSNSLKNKYKSIDLQEQIIRNRQMNSKGFISKSILNSTVDLLNQNMVLKNNLKLQRKKSIVEKDILLMRCYDKNNQVMDAQKTLNIYKQQTNSLQNKAETIINELKSQIASLKLECHRKNVEMQGLKLQMNGEILKRDQMLKQYKDIINKMSQGQMLKERNVLLNCKKQNILNKYQRKDQNTLQNIQNTKELLINQNQKLKHQIFKLQKTLSLHKKLNDHQVQESPPKITSIKTQKNNQKYQLQMLQMKRDNTQIFVYQQSLSSMTIEKWQKLFYSLNNLRNGVNRQIFSIFIQSSRLADNKNRNGFSIFLQKWKQIQINRIIPFLNAYFQMSSSILQCLHNKKASTNEELLSKIKEVLPVTLCQSQPQKLAPELQIKSSQVYKTHMKLKQAQNKQTRSQINLWVLSTVYFTNNQHQITDEQSLKNNLLYLFRLLSIEFRIEYPPVGKQNQYILDKDIRNCLLHYILVAAKQVVTLI